MSARIPRMGDTTPEPDLIAQASAGDSAARDALLRRHMPALVAYARMSMGEVLRHREGTMDIVQSALRDAIGALDDYEPRGGHSFRNWLFTYAMNTIRNKARHHQAERRSPSRERELETLSIVYSAVCSPTRQVSAKEQVARMEAAFDRLPDEYREVILLSRIEGASHREVGERLGKSEGAARMLVSRALARLANLIEEPPP